MKKNFCKLMALAIAALMMMSTLAFAENPNVDATDVAATTVTLTGLTAGEEATVLVVKSGTDLASLANTSIVFIDQVTIDKDGNAVFTMDISAAADAENGEIDMVDVYCGYTSMEGAALAALNVPVETIVEDPLTVNYEKSKIYNDAFGMQGYKRVFIKLDTEKHEPGKWTLTHVVNDAPVVGSEIYYSVEREGFDCMLKTEATDVAGVVAELKAEQTVPSAELTINMYGDFNNSNNFSGADTIMIKRYIKEITGYATPEEFGIKNLLLSDASNDGKISGADTIQLKRIIKEIPGYTSLTVSADK